MFRLSRSTKLISRPIKILVVLSVLAFSANYPVKAAFIPLEVSSSDISVNEGAGSATFTLSLTRTPCCQVDVTVDVITVDGTAKATSDYTPVSKNVTIPYGSKSVSFVVPLINDSLVEPTKTFTIFLSNAKVNSDDSVSITRPAQWAATIIDNDTPIGTPPPVPPPVVAPPPPAPHPGTVTPTPPPPPPTDPPPTTPPPVVITPPSPNSFPSVTINVHTSKGPARSVFVQSIPDPTQLTLTLGTFVQSSLLALLLILLILFPAELFNSTLQSNYDEVTGWFKLTRTRQILNQLQRLPSFLALLAFAAIAAVINSQLSPDFGFNQSSLALVVGVFLTLIITSLIYDLLRGRYLRRRFGLPSRLRIHVIGLVVGGILVIASRLANFLPGYLYGLFTALVFSTKQPSDEQDGEGLAVVTIGLLAVAAAGYFAWIPVKAAAAHAGASFVILVLDATLSSLWVTALIAIVFGLAPIRFFYGDQVKKWSKSGWWAIYILGVGLFSFTLLRGGVYGTSNKTSLVSVLALFGGFGAFSLLFWSYFRYRHLWRHVPDIPEEH